jgi:hypothetical protein
VGGADVPLLANQQLFVAQLKWVYFKANPGFEDTSQRGSPQHLASPDATIYNAVLTLQTTLAPAATLDVDFRAFTAFGGEAVTAAKVLGFLLQITGDGGALRVEPGLTEPLLWPFAAGSAVTLAAGPKGAAWPFFDGAGATVSATARRWRLTSAGTAPVQVTLAALCGA